MHFHWSLLFLLFQLATVDAYYGFFQRFCAEYTRAVAPGKYINYVTNVNDGETCVLVFDFVPKKAEDNQKICEGFAPFYVHEAAVMSQKLQCTYKSLVKCTNERDMLIGQDCYSIAQNGTTCGSDLATIGDSNVLKWIAQVNKKQHPVLLVNKNTAEFRPVSGNATTNNLALSLRDGKRGQLNYVSDGEATDMAKLCVADRAARSNGASQPDATDLLNFCNKLKLFDVVTLYQTNACFVVSASYYPLHSFSATNQRCATFFGSSARHAPIDSEGDFEAANRMLGMLRKQEGSWSSFGTGLYVNATRKKSAPDVVHRNFDWYPGHEGNPSQLFQMEITPFLPEDRVSFHYAANLYSSLVNNRRSAHSRQLCKIGPGASMVKRDGACVAPDRLFVSDLGTMKCVYPPTQTGTVLGDINACPEYYEPSDFESAREYDLFQHWATVENNYTHINVNAMFNYGNRDEPTSYGKYTYALGKQLIYHRIVDSFLDAADKKEMCLHGAKPNNFLWNDDTCNNALDGKVAYYCTKRVE